MAIKSESIQQNDNRKFHLHIEFKGSKESYDYDFDTEAEAQEALQHQEQQDSIVLPPENTQPLDAPEQPASEMSVADAEELNSDVRRPAIEGEEVITSGAGQNKPDNDNGAGNTDAPHPTPEEPTHASGRAE